MKKTLPRAALLAIPFLALSSCSLNIFDFISSSSSYSYVSYDDSFFNSEERDGYTKQKAPYLMRQVGDSAGYPYVNSVGNPKILVIPVSIKGYEKNATAKNLERIKKAFTGENNIWQSVENFYKVSSFGRLNLDITVADQWYDCGKTAASIYSEDSRSDSEIDGVVSVVESALSWYKTTYSTNGQEFDSDNDGYVDGVWFIYSAPNCDSQTDRSTSEYYPTCWAYTTWLDNRANKNSPSLSTFAWASYDFMDEGYGTLQSDAHTFIHETGHMLGLDDYYDGNAASKTSGTAPLGFVDMMDANIIDHNVYSKWVLGWVAPFLIDSEGTITLSSSAKTGDCFIVPTSGGWNGTPFDEYLIGEFYTPENLNEKDSLREYSNGVQGFTERGLRLYHVDARLAQYKSNRTFEYTDKLTSQCVVAHSNTPSYGSDKNRQTWNYLSPEYRLIQVLDATNKRNFAKSYAEAGNGTLFQKGDSFSMDAFSSCFPNGNEANDGSTFEYSFTVTEQTSDSVTVRFSKN